MMDIWHGKSGPLEWFGDTGRAFSIRSHGSRRQGAMTEAWVSLGRPDLSLEEHRMGRVWAGGRPRWVDRGGHPCLALILPTVDK